MASGKIFESILLNIDTRTASLESGLKNAEKKVDSFTNKITDFAKTAAVAFGVSEVASFAFEVSKLAAEVQGVESAFKKLPNSSKLLNQLSDSVEGTQSNFALMKIGVDAFNQNVPLENLAEILNFVDRTADATNQDFQSLADTVINDIGKGSTKGLNQLGLSIENIQQRSKEIGFVPALMEAIKTKSEELGAVSSDQADRIDRLSASWEDYKISVGKAANETGILGTSLTFLTDILDGLSGKNQLEFLGNDLAGFIKGNTDSHIRSTVESLKELREETGAPLSFNVDKLIAKYDLTTDQAEQFRKKIEEINGTLSQQEIKNRAVEQTVKAAFDSGNVEAYIKSLDQNIYKSEIISEIRKKQAANEAAMQKPVENIANLTEQLNKLQQDQITQTAQEIGVTNDQIKVIQEKIRNLKELSAVQLRSDANAPKANRAAGTRITGDALSSDIILSKEDVEKALSDVKLLGQEHETQAFRAETAWEKVGDSITENVGRIGVNAMDSLAQAVGGLIAGQEFSFKSLIQTILHGLKEIIQGYLATAIAGLTSKEAADKGIYGLAIAAVGIGIIEGIFAGLPAFEKGGNYRGGLALVGESGPEIIDFNRGGRIYNNSDTNKMLSGDGSIRVEVVGNISGPNIGLTSAEYTRRKGRTV